MTHAFILFAVLLSPSAQAARPAFHIQAGAAQHEIRAQQKAVSFSWQERDILLERLRDPDPLVRVEALRALRDYVGQSNYVWGAVLQVLDNQREELAVRYQAVKTLSRVVRYPEVKQTLGRYATDPRTPAAFRGICWKALYSRASGDPQVKNALMSAAVNEREKAARMGAVWALANASHDPDAASILMRIASSRMLDMDLRAEAVRSLYRGMGRTEVRQAMAATAANTRTDPALRYPAILALSKVKTAGTQALLNDLVRREQNPLLRRAAIMALNPRDERIQDYFHLPRWSDNGVFIDPLENE